MSMATASIFARLGRSRFQNGFSASAPLPAGLEVQDQGQVAMPLADGDLVDGDVPQVLQLRPGEPPRQVALLHVLDQVPADAEVDGHVADGHPPPQFQGVALEGASVAPPGVGEGHLDLADGATGQASDAGDGQVHEGRPVADGQGAEAARDLAAVDDPRRAARRATTRLAPLADGEDHGAALVSGAGVLVAADAEGVVQEAGGHADLPVLETLNATPSGVSMSTLFKPGARFRRMNPNTEKTRETLPDSL
jgi:hypothetical protein